MTQVRVKLSGGTGFIHHFMTDAEALAYALAIKEMDRVSHVESWIMYIKIDGKEV